MQNLLVRSLVGATIELNRDDEYPRKPGFFGCGMNTVALGKRQNFEFLQPPHSQRDPPGFLGEDDWEARAGLILFSALTLTLAPAQTTAVRPALLAKNLFASPWVRRAALSRASQAVVGCQRRGSLLNLLVRSLVGAKIESNRDDDEYPRKPGFFGAARTLSRAQKRQKFEFLQPPHSQRDPPGVHREDEWKAREGLILFSALTLTLLEGPNAAILNWTICGCSILPCRAGRVSRQINTSQKRSVPAACTKIFIKGLVSSMFYRYTLRSYVAVFSCPGRCRLPSAVLETPMVFR